MENDIYLLKNNENNKFFLGQEDAEWIINVLQEVDKKTVKKLKNFHYTQLLKLMYLAITGKEDGPPIYEIMKILGREECLRRIEAVTNECKS